MLAMIATAQKRLGKAEIGRFSIVTAPGRPYDPAALKAAVRSFMWSGRQGNDGSEEEGCREGERR
jgi:hypothetical protein